MTRSEVTLRARPLLSIGCTTLFVIWTAVLLIAVVYRDMSVPGLIVGLVPGFAALLVAAGSHPRFSYLRLTPSYFEYRVSFVRAASIRRRRAPA